MALPLKIRVWLRLASLLQAVGVYPTMRRMADIPVARRKASKPAWWMTGRLPRDVAIDDHPSTELGMAATVRTYSPIDAADPLPTVVFMHGGGFVNGGLDSMQFLCAWVAAAAEALVVSVDYPLAPEEPYPAALDVCYEALCWMADRGGELGGDTSRLILMGDSAGGNLAAALSLLAKRNGRPSIERQILIYPALDATLSAPSMRAGGRKRQAECDAFYMHYVGEGSRADELVSPLLATDLSDLPPAVVITADLDALKDDGCLYAERLRRAGVPVRHTNYLNMPHGFLSMPRLCSAAPYALTEIVAGIVGREIAIMSNT